jgi:branched-chain amino acid transport system substrate-binding protein
LRTNVLGYNYAPYGYGAMQVLAQAVEGTHSLDHGKLADYMYTHAFDTVVGGIAFGPDGEWVHPHLIVSQYQNFIGNDIAQFKDGCKQVIVWPQQYKTGDLLYPYDATK